MSRLPNPIDFFDRLRPNPAEPVDPLVEVLLTVLALSSYPRDAYTLGATFPKRLTGALRKARRLGLVEVDDRGVYLSEEGSAYMDEHARGMQLNPTGKPLNPHNWLSALKTVSQPKLWQCNYCGDVGTYDELLARPCAYVYPPCPYCGLTPLCSPTCPGIVQALSGEGVYVSGALPPETLQAMRSKGRT